MQYIWKIIIVASILLNLIAIWGFFHYVKYGGSPLGELKRMLTGSSRQQAPKIPYAKDNARIKKELEEGKAEPNRVVFLGASITRRWNLDAYFPQIHAINRGVGGQLAPSLITRFKRDVIDLQPDAVAIKFCSINIRPQIHQSILKDGMSMMVQLARANDIIPIVTTIVPPGKPEARIGDFSVIDSVKTFNEWLRDYARRNELCLIDYASAIEDNQGFLPRKYSTDPVHVNEDGYEILANTARPVIYSALGL